MKNLSLVLSSVSLVLAAVLLYLHFSAGSPVKPSTSTTASAPAGSGAGLKVAYFVMDSLDANYEKVKDARKQNASKEEAFNLELNKLDRELQQKAASYDEKLKANQMSQAEFEAAQRDVANMKDNLMKREAAAKQELMDMNAKNYAEIKKEIESFLKEYNKDKVYAYIFMYDANSAFMYCDNAYDITADVLNGLNSRYKKK